jgi:hypothetical protein
MSMYTITEQLDGTYFCETAAVASMIEAAKWVNFATITADRIVVLREEVSHVQHTRYVPMAPAGSAAPAVAMSVDLSDSVGPEKSGAMPGPGRSPSAQLGGWLRRLADRMEGTKGGDR